MHDLPEQHAIPEPWITRFLGWSRAKAEWGGSYGAMLICLMVYLSFVWFGMRESGIGHTVTHTVVLYSPGLGSFVSTLIAASAVISAGLPFCAPRLASVLKGAGLGLITGLLGSIAAAQVGLLPGYDRLPAIALGIMTSSVLAVTVVSVLSAAVAFVVGGALSSLVRRFLRTSGQNHTRLREIALWTVAVAVFCAVALEPQTKSLYFQGKNALVFWYETELTYRLVPSTWKGKIAGVQPRSFTLVIEEVRPDGQFTGYMDWDPGGRNRTSGKATGNHLVLHQAGFPHPEDSADNYDNIWIRGTSMTGTDQNGWYQLAADLVTVHLQPTPPQPAVLAQEAPPEPAALTQEPPPEPAALAQEREETGPRAPGAETVRQARSERLCKALGGNHVSLQDGCWIVVALQVRDRSYCGSISGQGLRDDCYVAFGVNEADRGMCEYLSSPEKAAACAEAVGGTCANSGRAQGAKAGCDAARTLLARARSDWESAGRFSFYGFRKTDVAPQSWTECDAQAAQGPDRELCQLERVRRNDPAARCEVLHAELKTMCDTMATRMQ